MLNYTKLLYSTVDKDRFHDQILPTSKQQTTLEEAKDAIRDHLKPRIKEATVTVLGMDHAVEPRFRTQGSQRYKICLTPAQMPPQEMDWDYGVYLPVAVWKDNGPPHEMARLYFGLVEKLLQDLCLQRGWRLVPGKDSCVRVQVASWGHIDIPLYAASEAEFKRVTESARSMALLKGYAFDSAEFAEVQAQQWDDLEGLFMATRSGEWKESDPEEVAKYFLTQASEFGDQLRRICRYVKAWRDHHWKSDGPTSVSIMIAVAQKFESFPLRDDLALEHAAQTLSVALAGPIHEIAINEGKEDFNRLDTNQRIHAAQKARELVDQLRRARQHGPGQESFLIAIVKAQLGTRVPARPDLVEVDRQEEQVRSAPARRVPPPIVVPTKAG